MQPRLRRLLPPFSVVIVISLLVAILAFFLSTKPLLVSSPLSRLGHLARLFQSIPAVSHPPTAAAVPTLAAIMSSSTPATPYARELEVAQLAVQRAARLTRRVFHETGAKGTLSKDDKSPVTVGDFGAQALIIAALRANFPDDAIVAEEEAASLRGGDDDRVAFRRRIWDLVRETRLDDDHAEQAILGGAVVSEEQMLDLIDAGASPGGPSGRFWVIDPIDGTKGFLRGGQYAVCLAMIEDGRVVVGVLGCPNLPVDDGASLAQDIGDVQHQTGGEEQTQVGVLFAATEGQGATSRPMSTGGLAGSARRIAMRSLEAADLADACFCESYESGHSDHARAAAIAARLGITRPSVRMDSQAKYGSVARGAGDIYLRLPTSATRFEKIWDHAAGDLIVRESGGEVTDVEGKRLDFSVGRELARNRGVVAAPGSVAGRVLEAVGEVMGAQ